MQTKYSKEDIERSLLGKKKYTYATIYKEKFLTSGYNYL
jgi:hypothetical protein